MPLLELENLRKAFGSTRAVDGVSLAIEAGEIVCLLGPSGCGKTTLLRLIAGLETADGGAVRFDGREMAALPPHRREFGMMFQEFALFPHKNVRDNVAFGLDVRGRPFSEIASRTAEVLALVDMSGYESRAIDQLSGGEQQRVALARALAVHPRLLLLDEPLGALDRALRERLMLDLRRILKEVGVTAISVTHDQTEAFAIADRIVVMNEGRIEQVDRPETLYQAPQTPFVARFLGYHNLLPAGGGGNGRIDTPLGPFPLDQLEREDGRTGVLLIKPDALDLEPQAGDIAVEGQLTAVSFRGRFYQIWIEAAGQTLMFEQSEPPAVAVSERGTWYIDPRRCMLL